MEKPSEVLLCFLNVLMSSFLTNQCPKTNDGEVLIENIYPVLVNICVHECVNCRTQLWVHSCLNFN